MVTASVFGGNSAQDSGGALFVLNAALVMAHCWLSGNFAGSQGGGLACDGLARVHALGGVWEGNSGRMLGGAVLLAASSSLLVEDSLLSRNTAERHGGALAAVASSSLQMRRCEVAGNAAPRGDGGALFLDTASTALVADSVLLFNAAGVRGGGVCTVGNARLAVSNSLVTHCSGLYGGALFVQILPAVVENSSFVSNSAEVGGTHRLRCSLLSPPWSLSCLSSSPPGTLYAEKGSALVVRDSNVTFGSAHVGGGIFVQQNCELTLDGVRVRRCYSL